MQGFFFFFSYWAHCCKIKYTLFFKESQRVDNFVGSYQPLPQWHNFFWVIQAELLSIEGEPGGRSPSENQPDQSDLQVQKKIRQSLH